MPSSDSNSQNLSQTSPIDEKYLSSYRQTSHSQASSSSESQQSSSNRPRNPKPLRSVKPTIGVAAARQRATELAQVIPVADPKNYRLFNPAPPCALSESSLETMHKKLNLPPFIQLRPFETGVDNINNPGPTRLIIWYDQVIAGLRLPILEFFVTIANHFHIPVNQLTPASISRAAAFCILTRFCEHPHPTSLFCLSQQLKWSLGLPMYYFSTVTGGGLSFLGKPQFAERQNYEREYAVA